MGVAQLVIMLIICIFLSLITQGYCSEQHQAGGLFSTVWNGVKITARAFWNSIINIWSATFAKPVTQGIADAINPNGSSRLRLYGDLANIIYPGKNITFTDEIINGSEYQN